MDHLAPSPRQIEVLLLWATGHPQREVASMLFISVRTVENYLNDLRDRLGARTTAHALVICISRGYIFIDSNATPCRAEPIEMLLAA